MQTDDGLTIIESFEDYAKAQPDGTCTAYRCPEKVWTCGFGSTQGVTASTAWTRQQATSELKSEADRIDAAIARHITVPLHLHQGFALRSWLFNVGCGWLGEGRHEPATLVRRLNDGQYDCVPSELMRFCHGAVSGKRYDGLIARRKAEGALWRLDDDWRKHVDAASGDGIDPRAVRQANPDATMADVRAIGSKKLAATEATQNLTVVGAGAGVASSIDLSSVNGVLSSAHSIQGVINDVGSFAASPFGLTILGGAAGYYIYAEFLRQRILGDFRRGDYRPSGAVGE